MSGLMSVRFVFTANISCFSLGHFSSSFIKRGGGGGRG